MSSDDLSGSASYYQEEGDNDGYYQSSKTTTPWWKTKNGVIGLSAAGVVILIVFSKSVGRRNRGSSYSFEEECQTNLMTSVSADCGAAIFDGDDCDGTLDCQVAHNHIYCAKCGCNNELIGQLFEDLPSECADYF